MVACAFEERKMKDGVRPSDQERRRIENETFDMRRRAEKRERDAAATVRTEVERTIERARRCQENERLR